MAKNDNRGTGAGASVSSQPTRQKGDGNTSVTGEKHDAAKAEHVSAASRLSSGVGPTQPTRQNGDGNTTVSGEKHDSAKAERVPESARW
jgi:hypothetical protein